MNGLGTATQDGGIAGLQAQAGGIDGHVGARLVDDADHAQRHAHLADLDAGRQVAHALDLADRVRQGGDLAQAFDHRVDHLRRQRQAVDHGRLQTIGAGSGQIQLVGGGQLAAGGIEGVGGSLQRMVLLRGAGSGEHPRGGARSAAQAGHIVEHGLGHGRRRSGSWKKSLIIAGAPRQAQHCRADGHIRATSRNKIQRHDAEALLRSRHFHQLPDR